VIAALAAARELPQLSLEDALELTLLVARKDPPSPPAGRGPLAASLPRRRPAATVEEAALAASALIALTRRRVPGGSADAAGHGRKSD
jgi:hypothetical protein